MTAIVSLFLSFTAFLLAGALFLQVLPRWGKMGKISSDFFCQAPGLDLALGYFTLLPLGLGFGLMSWLGLGVGWLAGFVALWLWIFLDEFAHRNRWKEAKIHRTTSQLVGGWRNHLALWLTSLVIPVFWLIRLAQVAIYPFLTKLVKFPKYEAKDWVSVSRHKFDGLVGFDLVWCLYCDWMTGVWSLGSEMLRNVESFWCPIRFSSTKKCANCQIDFPDIDRGWIAADGTMEDVTKLIQEKQSNTEEYSWFGHPSRLENSEKV